MKLTILTTLLTLTAGVLALPENIAARDSLEARAGCPNGPSSVACGQACDPVVANACKKCKDFGCTKACQTGARMRKCLDCCAARCATC